MSQKKKINNWKKLLYITLDRQKKKIYFKSSEIADRTTELFSCSYLQCSLNQKDNTAILRDSCGRLEKKKRKKKSGCGSAMLWEPGRKTAQETILKVSSTEIQIPIINLIVTTALQNYSI